MMGRKKREIWGTGVGRRGLGLGGLVVVLMVVVVEGERTWKKLWGDMWVGRGGCRGMGMGMGMGG